MRWTRNTNKKRRALIEYASVAWPKLPAHLRDRLERFQRRALKITSKLHGNIVGRAPTSMLAGGSLRD